MIVKHWFESSINLVGVILRKYYAALKVQCNKGSFSFTHLRNIKSPDSGSFTTASVESAFINLSERSVFHCDICFCETLNFRHSSVVIFCNFVLKYRHISANGHDGCGSTVVKCTFHLCRVVGSDPDKSIKGSFNKSKLAMYS